MGYKFTPWLVGLTRGDLNPWSKNRADGRQVCEEIGIERRSASKLLDRGRSSCNEYTGFRSGGECWGEMEKNAGEYRVKGRTKRGTEFVHKLRYDAVIGYAVTLHPPDLMAVDWSQEDFGRFYSDCLEVLEEVEPRLFRQENIRMTAIHRDEGWVDEAGKPGEHLHVVGTALDQEGRYCGNLLDAALFSRVRQEFPGLMRERGWPLDDLDAAGFYSRASGGAEKLEELPQAEDTARQVEEKAREVEEIYREAVQCLAEAKEALRAVQEKERELAAREREMERFIRAGQRALGYEALAAAAEEWKN